MSRERNKEIVRRFVEEAQSRGNLAAIDEYLAPDFVDHSALPGVPPTREGVRALFSALRAAFPDLRAEIHEQFAEGDMVITRKTLRGTHRGEFLAIAPTGRVVGLEVIDILRVVDGKLSEHWNVVDLFGLFQQMGAFPPMTASSPG
jgi:steroid delta-isomerase-like uncharacterized protein